MLSYLGQKGTCCCGLSRPSRCDLVLRALLIRDLCFAATGILRYLSSPKTAGVVMIGGVPADAFLYLQVASSIFVSLIVTELLDIARS